MRIRKISQMSGFTGVINNSYTTSNIDTYSCNYINSIIGNLNTILATLTTPSNNGGE